MTTRRQFLRGTVSAAVAASLPGGDGVALESAKHPAPALLPMVGDADTGMFSPSGDTLSFVVDGVERARSLARSMSGTRERIAADVMNRVFDLDTPFDLSSLEEIEVDIKRGGSTDENESNV